MMRVLDRARDTIDVCVYAITCDELGGCLLAAHRCDVTVRVIVDAHYVNNPNSQIRGFVKAGIPVYTAFFTSELMHNKYAIIDRNIKIRGSFNWSENACSNSENVVIRTNDELTPEYITSFSELASALMCLLPAFFGRVPAEGTHQ